MLAKVDSSDHQSVQIGSPTLKLSSTFNLQSDFLCHSLMHFWAKVRLLAVLCIELYMGALQMVQMQWWCPVVLIQGCSSYTSHFETSQSQISATSWVQSIQTEANSLQNLKIPGSLKLLYMEVPCLELPSNAKYFCFVVDDLLQS